MGMVMNGLIKKVPYVYILMTLLVYGHLDNPHGIGSVYAGEIIGYSNAFSPPHLHFAVHPGYDPEPTNPWRGYTDDTNNTYGFTDPIPFLAAHPAGVQDKSLITTDWSTIYWLQNNKIYHVIDADTLNTMQNAGIPGWSWSSITTVSSLSSHTVGPEFISTDSSSNDLFIRVYGGNDVYLINNGNKEYVSFGDCNQMDCWNDIIDIPQVILDMFSDETLSISFSASPSNGDAPLATTLTADISGTATDTINYTFWWNCSDPGTGVDSVSSVCGDPWNSTYGAKFDGVWDDPKATSHTYSTADTYTAKVIAERGNAPPVEKRIAISVNTSPEPPSKAINPSPSNTATGRSINTDISWSDGDGATSYDVYFGTDSTPDSDEFKGNQTSISYDLGLLNYNTTYYWRMDAKNANGTTTGDLWSFTTEIEQAPDLPDLTVSATIGSSYTSGQIGVQIPVTVNRSGGDLGNGTYAHAKLYWSTDTTWDTSDTILWSSNDSKPDFPNSVLNSNGYKTVTATINIPNVTSSGTYYIIAYADAPTSSYPSGYYTESNRNNNTAIYMVNVLIEPHALAITDPAKGIPNPVIPGGTAKLSVTAVDSLGHTLNYDWTVSCPNLPTNGILTGTATRTPTWIAPKNLTGSEQDCTVEVTVSCGQRLNEQSSYIQIVSPGGVTSLSIIDGIRLLEYPPYELSGKATVDATIENISSATVILDRVQAIGKFEDKWGSVYERTWPAEQFQPPLSLSPTERYQYTKLLSNSFPGLPTTATIMIYVKFSNIPGQEPITNFGPGATAQLVFDVGLPSYRLTINKSGTGTGLVTSTPTGISCGSDCTESYNQRTDLTLIAAADAGSVFSEWSGGGCSETESCVVTMNDDTTITATFDIKNQSPVANAGPDQTVDERELVALDGSNSYDPDDGIASYQWNQIDGPSVILSSSETAQATFIALEVGLDGTTLTFQLIVTDYEGLQDMDTVIINISNAVTVGDIDDSATIDLNDAILALQILTGIEQISTIHKEGDVNMDVRIGLEEAIHVLQIVAGIRTPPGEEEKYAVGLFSGHWPNGYYAQVNVKDPNRDAISVTAAGAGINGIMDFVYYPSSGWWWNGSNIFLGSSTPTEPQIFTISITDASGIYNYEKMITGYVSQFATDLSPTGNVSEPIAFSWTEVAGATGYSVELSHSNYNRIWNAYNLPSTTTSVAYDGPSLTIGGTYHYDVVCRIETDGVWNSSHAKASFTVTE